MNELLDYKTEQALWRSWQEQKERGQPLTPTLAARINRLSAIERHEVQQILRSLMLRKAIRSALLAARRAVTAADCRTPSTPSAPSPASTTKSTSDCLTSDLSLHVVAGERTHAPTQPLSAQQS